MLLAVMMVIGMFPVTAFAAEATIPGGLGILALSDATAIEAGENLSFSKWGMEGYSAPSWVATVPAGTETVKVTFDAVSVPSWSGNISGGWLTYDAASGTYNMDGKDLAYEESNGGYTITLDVKSMIENGNYYVKYNSSYAEEYALGFKYAEAVEEKGAKLSASADKTEVEIGETLEVAFEITGNTGFTNIELTLDFDTDVLKFTGLKINPDTESYEGRFGGGATVANTDPFSEKYGFITNARSSATTTDGKLFVAMFEAIASGNTSVGANITLMENSGEAVEFVSKADASDAVKVKGTAATAISLDKTEVSLEEGGNTIMLVATVEPADTSDEMVWTSSDEKVATVSKGIVTSVKPGTATITVTAGSVSAECVVTVTPEENIIRISPDGYRDFVDAEMTGVKAIQFGGETLELRNIYKVTMTGYKESYLHNSKASFVSCHAGYTLDGTHVLGDRTWGSSMEKVYLNGKYGHQVKENIVSYDELKAAVGEENMDKLGVTENDVLAVIVFKKVSATFNYVVLFDIEPVAATGISITESVNLGVGYTEALTVEVTPLESTDEVVWTSSDESVATVDENGVVTAIGGGKATITATVGNLSDTCEVSVTDKVTPIDVPDNDVLGTKMEKITVLNVTVTGYNWVEDGGNRTLTVFIEEDNADAMVEFKTNEGRTIENVKIENGEGSCTHVLSKYWVTDTWTVEFKPEVPATSLELDKTEMEVLLGRTNTITATLSEGSTDIVEWSSSDETIATVDAKGVVSGLAEGKVTITAKVRDMVKTCEVTVKAVHAESITIEGEGVENGKLRVKKGERPYLTYVIEPEEITDEVIWSTSDNEVFTMDEWTPGYFYATVPGTAIVTVTAGEGEYAKSASVEVEVYEVKAESITLDKTEAEILTVESLVLKATVNPEDHTDGNIAWTSSDEAVATVSGGTVTPVAVGEATITAKVGNIEATCKVTVKEPEEGTVLYKYDGLVQNGWPQYMASTYGINALTMGGAKYESLANEGEVYTVILPSTTAKDAEITLKAYACGSFASWLGVNWHEGAEDPESWEGYENKLEHTFKLSGGEATVKVRAYKTQGAGASREGTKTFNFVVAKAPEKEVTVNVAPSDTNLTFYTDAEATAVLDPEKVVDNGIVDNKHQYVITVSEGTYSYRGTDSTGLSLGGMSFTVDAETTTVNIRRVHYYSSKSKTPNVGDFSLKLATVNGDPVVCGTQFVDDSRGAVTPVLVLAMGSALKYQPEVTLSEAVAENFVLGNINQTSVSMSNSTMNSSFSLIALVTYNITAPKDAKIQLFNQTKNYVVEEIEATGTVENTDGTVTVSYKVASGSNYSYRVSKEGEITYAGYFRNGTAEDVVVNYDESPEPDTLAGTASMSESSVFVNVNSQNELDLGVGETFRLRAIRGWQIVNNATANIMIEPDYNYTVLSGGEHIELVPVTDKCTGSAGSGYSANWMDIKGVSEGVAIIEVSYDAIVIGGQGTSMGGIYSATDPSRKILVVINVGGSETAASITAEGFETAWDAEFDTVYFAEDSGEFTFTAKVGETDAEKAELSTDNGATWVSVASAEGKFTASGLVDGNNIIRLTANGQTAYQVVRAAKVSYTITVNGEELGEGEYVGINEEFVITFDGLYTPMPKMSGIYNPGYVGWPADRDNNGHKVVYTLPEGWTFSNSFCQYDFAKNNAYNLTASAAGTYELTGGYIRFNNMGDPAGAHRNLTDDGRAANMNAGNSYHFRCVLPDITVNVSCGEGNHMGGTATCESGAICEVCGAEYSEALGHSWKDATCTEPKTCETCGETEGEALGHSWKDATCTEPKTCETCGETEGEALGHKGGEATCSAKAVCEVCGSEYGELDPDNHKLHYEIVTEPTCEEEGERRITCENGCDYEVKEPIEALGHDWSAWKTVKAPTHSAPGVSERVCAKCGEIETELIPKLTGDYTNPGVTVIIPGGKTEDEANPNTGAPVISAMGAMAVLAGAAVIISKMNKR